MYYVFSVILSPLSILHHCSFTKKFNIIYIIYVKTLNKKIVIDVRKNFCAIEIKKKIIIIKFTNFLLYMIKRKELIF